MKRAKRVKRVELSDDVFAQRRKIMELIYEAREIIGGDLPYIKIQIVEYINETDTLGTCYLNKDHVVISKECAKWSKPILRWVVWHELGHAYFNARHDEECPLMKPRISLSDTPQKAVLARVLKRLKKQSELIEKYAQQIVV